jgi:hypothetical protein
MNSVAVVFFLVLALPDVPQPIAFNEEAASLEECLEDVRLVLTKVSPPWRNGATVQAGCVVKPAATMEH